MSTQHDIDRYVRIASVINRRREYRSGDGGELYAGYSLLNENNLLSAIGASFQEVSGVPVFAPGFERAAALFEKLTVAHAFKDGNKRTAIVTALFHLYEQGIHISPPDLIDVESFVENVVSHVHTHEDIVRTFQRWSEK